MYRVGRAHFLCVGQGVIGFEMAQVGQIQVPHVRWGGRWAGVLKRSEVGEEWTELVTEYKPTTAYQVARSLNLGGSLPAPPAGQRFEFGSRLNRDGTSTLLVRVVDVETEDN